MLDGLFDPRDAESWDAVGLVCGDPEQPVRRILFAVDPVAAVVDEALRLGADLVVTHHPLLLTAVHGVPVSDPRGAIVHRLIKAGVALFTAHTNADVASPGVSDALAAALGLVDLRPLEPLPGPALDGLVTYVPYADATRLLDALSAAGAGAVGDYSRCAWQVRGEGTFVPGPGASPAIGAVGGGRQRRARPGSRWCCRGPACPGACSPARCAPVRDAGLPAGRARARTGVQGAGPGRLLRAGAFGEFVHRVDGCPAHDCLGEYGHG